MSKHILWALAFVSVAVTAGNAPVVAMRAGPSPIAAPSQAQTGAVQVGASNAGTPQTPVSLTVLGTGRQFMRYLAPDTAAAAPISAPNGISRRMAPSSSAMN